MAERKHHVIKLTKNHLYPTYQLYAVMANKKTTPQDGLRLAALTVMGWLRERLGEDAPSKLAQPLPEDYLSATDANLPSVHINCGYVIDIVSLPDRGVWSLQITEPDLGSDPGNPEQDRLAVPGRVIETDVGFHISGQTLECGFKTVISDPDGVSQDAEVYRLAVVRRLMADPNFGLRHISPLSTGPIELKTVDQMKNLLETSRDKDNQLPTVVFTYARVPVMEGAPAPAAPILGQAAPFGQPVGLSDPGALDSRIQQNLLTQRLQDQAKTDPALQKLLDTKPASKERADLLRAARSAVEPRLDYDCDAFALQGASFCRTCILSDELFDRFASQVKSDLKPGDILLLHPWRYKTDPQVFPWSDSKADRKAALEELTRLVISYPRRREVDYGSVAFLSTARSLLIDITDDAQAETRRITVLHEESMQKAEAKWTQKLSEEHQAAADVLAQLERQKEYADRLQQDKNELYQAMADQAARHRDELEAQKDYIECLERRLRHPAEHRLVADWVRQNFPDRILLHPRAVDLLGDRSAKDVDLDTICDAIDFLATDLWDQRYRRLPKDVAMTRCSKKYGRPFEVKPTGAHTIETYPNEYNVKYSPDPGGTPVDTPLDYHLRVGNDPEILLRIYFFYDDKNQCIVIGALPRHLRATSIQ